MKYIKQEEFSVIQYDGSNNKEIMDFVSRNRRNPNGTIFGDFINTAVGRIPDKKDWLVKDWRGRVEILTDTQFQTIYREKPEDSAELAHQVGTIKEQLKIIQEKVKELVDNNKKK